ncbi:MAG TPA: FecR domain-containing protein [Bryobacteraceae bacterium]|nr:FecR domain-containing protein [Bryobacteraceae bacterium]
MSPESNDLDRILNEIREEEVDPAAVEAAAARVRARLPHAALRSCEDFQALIPEYRAGTLTEARALLVKDHTRECLACRKALESDRHKVMAFTAPRRATAAPWFRWAMAAGIAGLAVLTGYGVWDAVSTGSSRMVVEAANGTVYRVAAQGSQRLQAGAELTGAGEIRTGSGSGAVVRLRDGSLVEMRERSAFSVSEAGRDLTVHLAGGNVIVEAAKRRTGHLYVAAPDCRVSVTGTVFSVNSGVKGSRVSVIEGEVRVAQSGREQVLHAGDQYSSTAAVGPIPVADEIAWSRNFEQHMALVKEFTALGKKMEQVRMPELRYSSRLMAMLPADTVVYAAIPNIGKAIGEAHQIMRQRAAESPVLAQWWEQNMANGHANQAIEELQAVSEYLGDEIVVTATRGADGKIGKPVALAEVKRTGLRDHLQARFEKAGAKDLRVSDSLETLAPVGRGEAVIYAGRDLAVVAADTASLRKAISGGGFAGTAFGNRVAESYRDGAGFVFAADLEKMKGAAPAGHRENRAGFDNFKYVVLEQKESGGRTDTHAVLAFQGNRKGVAGWLGRPGHIGALDYVSPEAGFAAAFTLKDPVAIFDEMLAAGEMKNLAKAETELGINVRNDLLASLGGEITVAMDGPALPVPSWKLVAEARDANRLQWSIQAIVQAYNRHAAGDGKQPAQLTQEAVAGRTWHRLVIPGASSYGEAHYTFDNGYVIAAPSRTLVERAIGYKGSGYTLARSAAFTALLPRDRYADFSGMVYQNMGTTLGPLLGAITPNGLTAEQKKALESAAAEMAKPMLFTFYGEDDRIIVASTGNLLALNPANLMRMSVPMAAAGNLFQHGKRHARAPHMERQ